MRKLFKITIVADKPGGVNFVYPEVCTRLGATTPILYGGGSLRDGDSETYCIAVLNDEDVADQYLESVGVEEITPEEANQLAKDWGREGGLVVKDQPLVNALTAKLNAGLTLTKDEEDALNPDHPKQGIVREIFDAAKWTDKPYPRKR